MSRIYTYSILFLFFFFSNESRCGYLLLLWFGLRCRLGCCRCFVWHCCHRGRCFLTESNWLELVAFLVFDNAFESFEIDSVHGCVVVPECLILDKFIGQSLADQVLVFETHDGAVAVWGASYQDVGAYPGQVVDWSVVDVSNDCNGCLLVSRVDDNLISRCHSENHPIRQVK